MPVMHNKNKSRPSIDPCRTPQLRCPGSENSLSILTLKVLTNKCDSNHEIAISKNPIFKEVFHDLLCQKLFASQLILKVL